MPLYQYECVRQVCKCEFEYSVSLKDFDTAKVKCPNCGAEAKRKLTALKAVSQSWKSWRL